LIEQLNSELALLHKEIKVLIEKENKHDHMEETLRESEELYRMLLRTSPDAVTVMDLEGKIIEVSHQTVKLHGFSRSEELVGKNVFELIAPEDRKRAGENLKKTILEGAVKPVRYRLLKKDGAFFLGEVNASLIKDASGKPKAFIGTTRDITKQVLAEKALQESEERYRAVVEDQSDLICRFLPDTTLTFVNKAYADYFGKNSKDLLGHTFLQFIPEKEHQKVKDLIISLNPKDPFGTHEHRVINSKGELRWQQWVNRAIFDESGAIFEFQAVGRDITDQKKAEEILRQSQEELEKRVEERTADLREANRKLQEQIISCKQIEKSLSESEEKFRYITEISPFPISLIDSSGRYLYINKTFTEVFGYTMEDIPDGKAWFQLAYPKPEYRREAVSFWKSDLANLEKGMVSLRVFRVKCKDGSFRDIIFRPIAMEGDQWFIIYEDITKRKQAEEEVYKAKEYLEKVFHSVTDSIIVTDMNTHVVTCNDASEKIFGYMKKELVGKSIKIFFPDQKAFKDMISESKRKIRELGYFEGEAMLRHKKGHMVTIAFKTSMLKSTSKKAMGIIWVGRDITEQKKAELAKERLETSLHQAQKMQAIGTLAGGIAHDFNNILSVILGYIELSLETIPGVSPIRSNMDEVIEACKRGKDLVRQILTFSRKVELERKPVKIQPILNEAIRFMRASLPSTIEIRQKIDPECGIVMANPTQIHQIIMNLCSNAYHSMRASGGTLEITLEEVKTDQNLKRLFQDIKDGSYLRLTVRDTGHGIEKSNLERIFDPFFTTKPPGEGSGMGLSTVHGIVQAHEGKITVESEIGKGTLFHIYFPCLGREITTKEFKSEAIPKGQERILFVDDEPSLVNTAKIILERYGYKVTAVTNTIEALEIFHGDPDAFDLVITDQTLPSMTGANLATQLRLIRPTIPIILTSGYSEVITPEKAREIGICEYIMKPFFARDLAKIIRRVLDQEKDK